ncbi:MAG: glutathione transferase GstA [Candidatus Accumulibacter phosphatis]|jgi:glutathione S-transferase|uniref:Glutathione S-transferase GST-6.0 n=2 Tax=Candidatus Accumulibacter TaxID=327159 RepID=A0A080LW55_9PROT|nr:glutathione transferase GstA [Candidatus Accumulibacter contiguus]KFB71970.1 MAG: Glutathione S-transferase GST-6.0 [Candidatus Accumulibacter phosphatis]MBL8408303.1 glutathione transferase GstA [Accumulibacter sp.]NMQ04194.1 glutathione transferase GstA [Candidatus Accumulibacter contiguus]
MNKQIVVCMDGTWNDPIEQTNVYRLFEMLPGREQFVEEQGPIRSHLSKRNEELAAFYLKSVGNGGRTQGLLGSTQGIGLHDCMIDAYVLVSQMYQSGDKIWLFGFSRGAWAARSLCAFIARTGLIWAAEAYDDTAADMAEKIWLAFKEGRGKKRGGRFWKYHDETPIRMIGVWDTVGEFGVPEFNGLRMLDRDELRFLKFADRELSPRVEYGRQALAIDEERSDFRPTLWNERAGIKQVWFPGVHADVGGGYEHCGLSDISLEWMMNEVNDLDASLRLLPAQLSQPLAPDPLEDRHDETHNLVWRSRPHEERKIPDDAQLHPCVLLRLQERSDYRPKALEDVPACAAFYPKDGQPPEEELQSEREPLPFRKLPLDGSTRFPAYAHKWWNASGVEVDAGEKYRIEASGAWTDKGTPSGADGYESKAWFLQLAEGSRRLEERPWFSLVAAIHPRPDLEANNPDSENLFTGLLESAISGVARIDDESSLIAAPNGCEIEISESGFLYFFANDSPYSYGNNSGFLTVEVTRIPWSAKEHQKTQPTPPALPGSLDVKLYYTPGTCSLAAHIALRECGLDFELVRVDIRQRKLADGSDFSAINPKGYVPVLEIDDGVCLTEVSAIVQYIADRRPESGLAPRPYTLERYQLQEWLAFISSELHKAFTPLFRPGTPEDYRFRLQENIVARLGYIATRLSDRDYLLGDQFTVADAYLFTVLAWSRAIGMEIAQWPTLLAFQERVGRRQSVRDALEAED